MTVKHVDRDRLGNVKIKLIISLPLDRIQCSSSTP